jgi:hypothetical protein
LNNAAKRRNNIAAFDAATGVATDWNPDADGEIKTLVVQGNTVYAGGQFTSIGGQARNSIAALDAKTGIATAWNPDANGNIDNDYRLASIVSTLAVSGNTVYAGGNFTSIGGQKRNYIAALDAAKGTATAWNPNANDTIHALAVSSSKVYAGGKFTSIGGQKRNLIAALDTATGIATTWNPDANGQIDGRGNFINIVSALAISGNTMYVGGNFTSIGGHPRNSIAALNIVTGIATAWNPNAEGNTYDSGGIVSTIAISGNTVYACGWFGSIGGQERDYVAALDVKTGVATAWNPNVKGFVSTLSVSGNRIYVGGFFDSVGGEARNNFAILLTGILP